MKARSRQRKKTDNKPRTLLYKSPVSTLPRNSMGQSEWDAVGLYIYIYGERERFRYYAAVRSTLGRQLQLFTKIFKGMMLDLKMM